MHTFGKLTFRTHMAIGTKQRAGSDSRSIDDAAVTDQHSTGDLRVVDHAEGANAAVFSDAGVAQHLHASFDNRVRSDADIGVDNAGLWAEDRYSLKHQLAALLHAKSEIERDQFGNGICAQNFFHGLSFDCDDLLFGAYEKRRHVSEVVFAMNVVSLELWYIAEQRFRCKGVNSGVDLGSVEEVLR